ncbi:MAG: Tol biopolymer transport system component, partial [Thalassolituus oleivorans]
GEEVDGRSDLYSLGTVLYEMIAGRLPFAGDYEQAILYGILNEPPEPLTTIRTGVPMELERIVGKLLAKDAARRYQSTDDLLVDLRGIDLAHGGSSRSRMDAAAVKSRAKSSADGWRRLLAGVLVGASIVGLVWMFWPSQPARVQAPTLRLTHLLGSSEVPTFMNLSADGTKLAYGTDRVYVADLTTGEERPIQGSENALGVEFSADGKELLMTMSVSVDRLSIDGGTALTVLRTTEGNPRAIWGPDDWIIYEDKQQIFKYSESRGERVQISRRDSLAGENDFDWPSLLPDGRTVMATLEITDRPRRLRFMDLESGVIKATIDFSAYRVHYLPSGHLVGFVSGEGVVVVPFDLDRLELTGPRRSVANVSFVNLYTVSRNGTLVYSESGPKVDTGAVSSIPAILTFPEFREPLPIPRGYYSEFRLSPDQTELAFIRRGGSGGTGDQRSLWVLNFESGGLRQLVGYSAVNYPAWTAGGDSIAYLDAAMTGLATSVMVRAADGTGRERRLSIGRSENRYLDITSDGSRLAYVARASDTAGILRIQDVRTGERTTVERTAQNNVIKDPRFSPDGDWVAFQQDDEVIVEALDGSGTSLNMSTGVREYPRWTRDGRFVLYVSNQGFVRRLKVPYAGGSVSGAEVALLGPVVPYFEVYGDGERAIVADQIETQAQADTTASAGAAVHVLVNWLSELENH